MIFPLVNWTVALNQPLRPTSHLTDGIVSADESRCQIVAEGHPPEPSRVQSFIGGHIFQPKGPSVLPARANGFVITHQRIG